MGPCEADCPAAILDLLSPTEHEYALEWRARCRANLAHRARKLADGDRIRLPEPVTFTDGNVAQEFVVCKRGRRLVLCDPQNGCFNRISRSEEHTSELQSLMRTSYAVFCSKKKTIPSTSNCTPLPPDHLQHSQSDSSY